MTKLLYLSTAILVGGALSASAHADLQTLIDDPNQWVIQTGDYANQRFSDLDQINAGNVGDLQVAWTFSTGVLRGHEGGPLVVGDIMYVHAPFPNTVFALDLNNDGKILWRYEPKQDPNVIAVMCCDTVNRGLAYADGKILLHQADTTLVALLTGLVLNFFYHRYLENLDTFYSRTKAYIIDNLISRIYKAAA